jgi:hypothetical protein
MTSNVSSAAPVSPGKAMSYEREEQVLPPKEGGYLPEIAVLTAAITVILIFLLVLFPKKQPE